jgi:hypothetical protein
MNIRQGNGVPIVVRARESLVHGEGEQQYRLTLLMENVRDIETSGNNIRQSVETLSILGL